MLAASPLLDWLLTPISGVPDHHLAMWAAWHGRLMVAGWGMLIPLGTLAARYGKVWPGQDWPRQLDDRRWWTIHRLAQSLGVCAATGGLWLAWHHAGGIGTLARWHGLMGWSVMLLGWFQIAGGILRGTKGGPTDPHGPMGDHYAMTRRRVLFEHLHKACGYGALALTLVTVPLGLRLADAPRWMWLGIALWWAGLAGVAAVLQRSGFCIDTYQAIWGPGDDHPGNCRPPIGLGISRRNAS